MITAQLVQPEIPQKGTSSPAPCMQRGPIAALQAQALLLVGVQGERTAGGTL